MSVPASTMAEVKPAGGFAAVRPRGIPVYVGCSSKGPTTAQTFGPRQQAAIASAYGAGPLSRKAGYMASQTNSDCIMLRVVATQRAASHTSATVVKNVSSTFTSTLTGAPTDGADVVIKFVLGGTTGTGPIDYQESYDGGTTFGSTIHLLTGTTITVLGVQVDLGSAKVVTTGDTIAWFQRAASASVLPQTLTKANASTASYAVTGTPVDRYRVRVEFLTGGTLGTTGITYRYCLDWDGSTGTWSPAQQLGTGTTIAMLDGTEDSGLTITASTSGTSTVDAGDVLSFRTTEPEAQWSDISAALTALRAAKLTWSFLAICTPLSATDAGSLDTLLTGWASSRRTWAVVETRDRETSETISAWRTRQLTDFNATPFASTRVFPAAGHAPMADPITGRRDRRSALVDYVVRLVTVPQISTDPGQVTLGALPASRSLYDSTGQQVEYDADKDPALFDRGFLVLRTFESEQLPGTYPAGGVCMPSAGDLGLVQLRRVLDAFEDALQDQARLELVSKFRRFTAAQVAQTKGKYKAGDIYEADARGIERRLRIAATNAVQTPGDASGITVTLNRTPTALGGGKFAISYSGQCAPLGYVYRVDGTAGLVDPAFEA